MEITGKIQRSERTWPPLAWIIVASALAHLWCLGSQFFLDDKDIIQRNEIILNGHFWEMKQQEWTFLAYIIQHRLFGISAPGFHAVNWLLHTSIACVLYGFGRDFLRDREQGRVALFGAVLFAVHPLGSEIPNYARTQDLAWVTLFSLLAAWALLRFLKDGGWMKLLGCLMMMAGATFSKGPGLIHALMMTLTVGAAFLQPAHWRIIKRYAWPVLGVLAVIVALWLGGMIPIYRGGLARWSEPRMVGHAYTLGRVFWEFAWRSVIPVSLCSDHHTAETLIPVGAKFWNIPDHGAMWAAAGFLALTAFSVFLIVCKSSRLIGVCLFIYCATILFRVLYLVPEFMPEYRIYPGLPWFCLGAALMLHAGLRKFTEIPPRIPAVLLVLVFILLSARRSFLWHDLDRLLNDELNQYPTQARAIWEWQDRDVRAGNWQAVIDRQRTVWPEVARRFHAENKILAPGRELPTGHFALAEVACTGHYARALAATEGPFAGLREIRNLENYMHRLHLDPVAHAIHWSQFNYDKALVLEMAGNDQAALDLLRLDDIPDTGHLELKRIEKKLADRATPNR